VKSPENVGVKEGLNLLRQKENEANVKKKKNHKGSGIPGKVVFVMKNVSKRFDDGFTLFENVNLSINQGYLSQFFKLSAAPKINKTKLHLLNILSYKTIKLTTITTITPTINNNNNIICSMETFG
jgi:ATPase subunit of ABC transporter with duplicated ATPase domains